MPQLLTPFPYLLSLVAFSSLRKAIVSYRVSFFRKGSRVTWDEGQTLIKTKNVLVVQPCKGSNLPLFTNHQSILTKYARSCNLSSYHMKIENWQDICDSIIRNKGRGPKKMREKKGPGFFRGIWPLYLWLWKDLIDAVIQKKHAVVYSREDRRPNRQRLECHRGEDQVKEWAGHENTITAIV